MISKNKTLRSQILADFISDLRYEEIPRTIQEKALRHIIDTVGVLLAGSIAPETRILKDYFLKTGHAGPALLCGDTAGVDRETAVLINGVAAHSFELDDTGGCDHSGAVVLPSAIAAVEKMHDSGKKVSGKEFIAAVVLGYDLARRALESCGAYEPHNKAGFHSTGTCGTFGSAAAAAKILQLDSKQIQNALGLAGSFSSGLWCCVHDGAQSKRLHAGHAAQGGFESACFAAEGFTGPSQIFEDVWGGFDRTFAPASRDPEAWTRELGKNWKIGRVSIKSHASCRSVHSSVDALMKLQDELSFGKDDIREINITINPFVYGMCGKSAVNPMNAAQLSIAYSLAALLLYGDSGLSVFSESNRNDDRIPALLSLIKFKVDESQSDDEEPTVQVILKDGTTAAEQVPDPLGSPTNPLNDEMILRKFMSSSSLVYEEEMNRKIAESLLNLEKSEDIYTDLLILLRQKPMPQKRDLF